MRRAAASACWFSESKLVESEPKCSRANAEHRCEEGDVLVPLAPETFDDLLGHEQASCEIVGDAFGLVDRVLRMAVLVDQAFRRVVEHVLELVHDGEPLSNDRLVGIDSDDPAVAVPVSGAGDVEFPRFRGQVLIRRLAVLR